VTFMRHISDFFLRNCNRSDVENLFVIIVSVIGRCHFSQLLLGLLVSCHNDSDIHSRVLVMIFVW